MIKTKLLFFALILLGLSCKKSGPAPNNNGQPENNFVYYNGVSYPLSQFFVIVDSSDYLYADYHVMDITLVYFSSEFELDYDQTGINGGKGIGNILVMHLHTTVFPFQKSFFLMDSWATNNIEDMTFYRAYDMELDVWEEEISTDGSDGDGFLHFTGCNPDTHLYTSDLRTPVISGKFSGRHTVFNHL